MIWVATIIFFVFTNFEMNITYGLVWIWAAIAIIDNQDQLTEKVPNENTQTVKTNLYVSIAIQSICLTVITLYKGYQLCVRRQKIGKAYKNECFPGLEEGFE